MPLPVWDMVHSKATCQPSHYLPAPTHPQYRRWAQLRGYSHMMYLRWHSEHADFSTHHRTILALPCHTLPPNSRSACHAWGTPTMLTPLEQSRASGVPSSPSVASAAVCSARHAHTEPTTSRASCGPSAAVVPSSPISAAAGTSVKADGRREAPSPLTTSFTAGAAGAAARDAGAGLLMALQSASGALSPCLSVSSSVLASVSAALMASTAAAAARSLLVLVSPSTTLCSPELLPEPPPSSSC
mmetsp:Transcript_30971/g.68625  ORF Transcript_30971/g.68625 Transcript_30971/m.68625 type:complete len:243 (-) Transcript_30971:1782-2510(-)